jgi:hypothetical protein
METAKEQKKVQQPHYYVTDIYECPVCGGGHNEVRSRVYGVRTAETPTVIWHDAYDWCNEFSGLGM